MEAQKLVQQMQMAQQARMGGMGPPGGMPGMPQGAPPQQQTDASDLGW